MSTHFLIHTISEDQVINGGAKYLIIPGPVLEMRGVITWSALMTHKEGQAWRDDSERSK